MATIVGTGATWTSLAVPWASWPTSVSTITSTGTMYANYNPITFTTTFTTTYTPTYGGTYFYGPSYQVTDAERANWAGWNNAYELTEEQRVQQAALEVDRRRRQAEYEADRPAREQRARDQQAEVEAAQTRATELLHQHLTAGQKRDVLEHGWFEVISDKGRRWRIRSSGISGNVDLMPESGDVRDASYCAHMREHEIPRSDHLLAQKLTLETDEDSFLRVANVSHVRMGAELPARPARAA